MGWGWQVAVPLLWACQHHPGGWAYSISCLALSLALAQRCREAAKADCEIGWLGCFQAEGRMLPCYLGSPTQVWASKILQVAWLSLEWAYYLSYKLIVSAWGPKDQFLFQSARTQVLIQPEQSNCNGVCRLWPWDIRGLRTSVKLSDCTSPLKNEIKLKKLCWI